MTDDVPGDAGAGGASDRSLLARLRHGQADASTALYLRYARRLQALAEARTSPALARRVEPEEIVQSVFRTFFRRAQRGDYDVPAGEDIWKLLLVMALNKVRTAGAHHKAAKRDLRRSEDGVDFEKAVDATPGRDESALATLRLVIDELLGELPEAQRKMVELRIEGHEVAEIAVEVRRSKRSVERVLQEFRRRLGALIGEEEG